MDITPFLEIPVENYLVAGAVLLVWGLIAGGKLAVVALLIRAGAELVSRGWHRGKR